MKGNLRILEANRICTCYRKFGQLPVLFSFSFSKILILVSQFLVRHYLQYEPIPAPRQPQDPMEGSIPRGQGQRSARYKHLKYRRG